MPSLPFVLSCYYVSTLYLSVVSEQIFRSWRRVAQGVSHYYIDTNPINDLLQLVFFFFMQLLVFQERDWMQLLTIREKSLFPFSKACHD